MDCVRKSVGGYRPLHGHSEAEAKASAKTKDRQGAIREVQGPANKPILPPQPEKLRPEPQSSEALVAQANEIFVGAPIYMGDQVIGRVSSLGFNERGDITTIQIQRNSVQTVPVASSDVAWGDSMQPTKSWQWTMGKPSKGVLLNDRVLNSPKQNQR